MRLRHVCLCHPPSQSVLVTLAFQRYFYGEKRKLCKTFFLWFQLPLIYYSLWHFKIFYDSPFFLFFYTNEELSPTTTTVIWFMCPTHCSPTPPFCVLAAFNAIFDMLAPWLQCTRTLGKKSARNSIGDLISIANHEHTCALSNATLTLESGKSWLFEHVCQAACLAVWRMCI